MRLVKRHRGRPPKYGGPARALTVTLPEDVLARLGAVDPDLGQAIVTVVRRRNGPARRTPRAAEISSYGSHAVIVVTPVKALKRIGGVQLVPIGNGRALISLAHAHSIPQLELDIRDLIERGEVAGPEREALEEITGILREARASRGIRLEERSIIVLETKRKPRRAVRT